MDWQGQRVCDALFKGVCQGFCQGNFVSMVINM
jgi:hypothetical protein